MSHNYTRAEFKQRGLLHLDRELAPGVFDLRKPVPTGDDLRSFKGAEDAGLITDPDKVRLASVLVPLIEKDAGLHVMLTKRSDALPVHAGQISFPGGKIEPGEHPLETALREAHEEVGLERGFVETLGYLPAYQTFTGFRIFPVIGMVSDGYSLQAEMGEVSEIFDVPLSYLMDASNHQKHKVEKSDVTRHYYAIPYEDYFIWGATAGIIRQLYRQVYQT